MHFAHEQRTDNEMGAGTLLCLTLALILAHQAGATATATDAIHAATATATATVTVSKLTTTGTTPMSTVTTGPSVRLLRPPVDDDPPEAPPEEDPLIILPVPSSSDGIPLWVFLLVGVLGGVFLVGVGLALYLTCTKEKEKKKKPKEDKPTSKEQVEARDAVLEGYRVGDLVEVKEPDKKEWLRGTVISVDDAKTPPQVWVRPDTWGSATVFPEIRPIGGSPAATAPPLPLESAATDADRGAQPVATPAAAPGATAKIGKVKLWDLRETPADASEGKDTLWNALSGPPLPPATSLSPGPEGGEVVALRVQIESLKAQVTQVASMISNPPASPHREADSPDRNSPLQTSLANTITSVHPVPALAASRRPPPGRPPPPQVSPAVANARGRQRQGSPPPSVSHKAPPSSGVLTQTLSGTVSGPAAPLPPAGLGLAPVNPGGATGPSNVAFTTAAGTWAYDQGRRYAVAPDGAGGLRFVEQTGASMLSGPLLRSSDIPPPRGIAAQWAVPLTRHQAAAAGRSAEAAGTLWLQLLDSATMQSAFSGPGSAKIVTNTAVRVENTDLTREEDASTLPAHIAAVV